MGGPPLLEVRNLTKKFYLGGFLEKRYLTAVEKVSFKISREKPSITTLAGESGSGKTTISRIILGLMSPTYGEVIYKGKSVKDLLKEDSLRYRREVQAVFQDPYEVFNPYYKVDHLLELPVKKFGLAKTKGETRKLIDEALDSVGLTTERALGKYPHQLSGGEAQRVTIARALLTRPSLLVADEPVSMVDMSLRAGILNVLLNLKNEHGMSIIFVTHDLSVAYYISDSIILLNRGRITEMGNADKVIDNSLHPYVRTLMKSIPIPDPKRRWVEKISLEKLEENTSSRNGCIFFERCPSARNNCSDAIPELIEIEPDHWVACHRFAN